MAASGHSDGIVQKALPNAAIEGFIGAIAQPPPFDISNRGRILKSTVIRTAQA
jgi:hypothetical protein